MPAISTTSTTAPIIVHICPPNYFTLQRAHLLYFLGLLSREPHTSHLRFFGSISSLRSSVAARKAWILAERTLLESVLRGFTECIATTPASMSEAPSLRLPCHAGSNPDQFQLSGCKCRDSHCASFHITSFRFRRIRTSGRISFDIA